MNKTPNNYWTVCIYLSLALAVVAVYWQVNSHDFINLDDPGYVSENPNIQGGLSRESITWAFTAIEYKAYWHPLTWLSHILDCDLFGLNPGRHHLTNLLLHLTSTLLLFGVLKRMTGSLWRSAFVAALFALHPLNVESVAWISERKNVLSTLFWMLTLAAYLSYVKQPNTGRYLLTLVSFALGLMAKPMLVTLPFVLLLLDYWPLGRLQLGWAVKDADRPNRKSANKNFQWRAVCRTLLEKAPFFALAAVSVYLSSLSIHRRGIVISAESVPMKLRIANALISYVNYIAKMFWPKDLAVYYPYPDVVPLWQSIAALLLLICVSFLLIWVFRAKPYLTVGWLWYLGTLSPAIGLMQAGSWPAMADRFAYVPLIGLFIIIAWAVVELPAKWRCRKVALGASAAAAILALSICTHVQLRYWRNSRTLFEHTVKATKDNYLAHYYLGRALAEENRIGEAVIHLREVVRLKPQQARPISNLAWFLATCKDAEFYDPAEAIWLARRACELTNYKRPEALDALAAAYASAGRFSEAVAAAQNALELAKAPKQKKLRDKIQGRLHLYRAGRPYVEPSTKNAAD